MARRGKPDPVRGLAHMFAAARYSAAGLVRLWREAAFRQEVAGGAVALLVLLGLRAPLGQIVGFVILWLALTTVEALNTALEVLVDHASPEWSEFARDAKDLGSLAVAMMLGANGLYLVWVVIGLLQS